MSCSIPILEIDLNKIRSNYKEILKIASTATIASMVKANGYGLGAVEVTGTLISEGCSQFFVATINEALVLRNHFPDSKVKIYVLNGVFEDDVNEFFNNNLTPVLNHLGQVEIWQNFSASKNENLPAILHVNTGMQRLAMPIGEINKIIQNQSLINNIKLEYVMSHLTCSEDRNSLNNVQQLDIFNNIIKHFPESKASLVNSCGVFLGKVYHFDMLRVGAALYGIGHGQNKIINLQNPVELHAPIIQLQKLDKKTSVGYNRTFITKDPMIIATIAIGYADGYPRALSNKGYLFIENYKVQIVGRISMDLLTIDVTDVPEDKIFLGQMVEVMGPNISPDTIASIADTIGYEILTLLSNRYIRIYK